MLKRIVVVVAALTVVVLTVAWRRAQPAEPFYFIQLTDPQLGMYRADSDFVQDAANFEFAIASVNRLHPVFVVVTGDLVNKPGDSAQVAEYHRIVAKLDPGIRLYNLPGNHDVGNIPTPATIARYRQQFGPDHYVFRSGSLAGVVLNSSLLQQPDSAPAENAAQEQWLRDTLAALSREPGTQIVVFQHHPWFLAQPSETGQYFNIPVDTRARYLALFKRYGVRYLFGGHYHQNASGHDGPIEMITSGPVGKPFGDTRSGLRIVMVTDAGLVHRYVEFGDLPNRLPDLPALQPDTSVSRLVVPGVTHRHLVFNQGPWSVNVLEIDLRHPELTVAAVRAEDRFYGREKVSSLAARHATDSTVVVAAINADFFNLATGESRNNQVIAGEVWKALRVREDPAASGRQVGSQFAITLSRQPAIDRFAVHAVALSARGGTLPLDGINVWPDSTALVLYTNRIGPMTPADSAGRHQTTVPLASSGRRGDTLLYRIVGRPRSYGASLGAGAAIAAADRNVARLAELGDSGATIRVVIRYNPDRGPLRELVGGWPQLVVHGRSVAESADAREGTTPSFSVTRHPRTGIGFSKDSTMLYLITVDGRQESSSGMSLVEFANQMVSLGVYEGLNLDGGGSTTMVIQDSIVNRPSDPEGERTVGNALLVIQRKPRP